ncbi:hypothetical protein [Okeania sp. SIO1F9]|uniref:hypothetical protein n=1 Tax=Okeania sp. SIO1F9 TaxID=2607813 RepID=UPI00144E3926|nr:hypothetical protein [Okeania sp. SIO1F9]NET74776.1 hypothetical protein [Okeania sp. SIO1F9]
MLKLENMDRRQETGDRRQETGDRRQELGEFRGGRSKNFKNDFSAVDFLFSGCD